MIMFSYISSGSDLNAFECPPIIQGITVAWLFILLIYFCASSFDLL
jgi:hypothetical protein